MISHAVIARHDGPGSFVDPTMIGVLIGLVCIIFNWFFGNWFDWIFFKLQVGSDVYYHVRRPAIIQQVNFKLVSRASGTETNWIVIGWLTQGSIPWESYHIQHTQPETGQRFIT